MGCIFTSFQLILVIIFISSTIAQDSCTRGGQTVTVGQHFTHNNFKFICEKGGNERIVACISPRDKVTEIPVGETREKCGWTWKCFRVGLSVFMDESYNSALDTCEDKSLRPAAIGGLLPPSRIFPTLTGTETTRAGMPAATPPPGWRPGQTTPKSGVKCRSRDGKEYSVGEEWSDDRGKYRCGSNGLYSPVACRTKEGQEVPIGQSRDIGDNKVGFCQKVGNTIFFIEQPKTPHVFRSTAAPTGRALGAGPPTRQPPALSATTRTPGEILCKQAGKTYRPGEEWSDHRGRYRCGNNGFYEPIACKTRDGQEIPVGSSQDIGNGRVGVCQKFGNSIFFFDQPAVASILDGSATSATRPPHRPRTTAASTNGGTPSRKNTPCFGVTLPGTYQPGEQWVEHHLVFECGVFGFSRVVGCVAPDGTRLNLNEQRNVNGSIQSCTFINGTAQFKQTPTTTRDACRHRGKTYQKFDTWRTTEFVYFCDKNGTVQITACLSDKGLEIKVGEEISSGGLIHKCIKQGRKFTYIADIPGSNTFAGVGGLAVSKPGQAGSSGTNLCVGRFCKTN